MGLSERLAQTEIIEFHESLGTVWGDIVPWSDYPNNDWSDIGLYIQAFTAINDREDGRNWPIFRNEQDLARIRASVRRFLGISDIVEAVKGGLAVYVFGKGMEVDVVAQPKQDVDPVLIDNVKRVVDRFIEDNTFINSADKEIFLRTIDDGECQIGIDRHIVKPKSIMMSFFEADNLKQPMAVNSDEFDQYLLDQHGVDVMAFVPSWSFGILTPASNTALPLLYYVQRDSSGSDWDVYSSSRFLHLKKNVTRNTKRGISDWYCVKDRVLGSLKLVKNLGVCGAVQAAIAWIEEPPPGTQQSQLGYGPTDAVYPKMTNVGQGGGTRTQSVRQFGAGSIPRVTPGLKFIEPPGGDRYEGFQIVEEILERLTATRFLMPYYMISADNSQSNFASALVAESPFVKARETDQIFFGGAYESLFWKVVNFSHQLGLLDTRGVPVDRLKELVNIKCEFPQVATRDRSALVDQLVKEVELGVTSRRTASVDLGRDYDEEIAMGAKPQAGPGDNLHTAASSDQPSQTSSLERTPDETQPGELSNASTLQFRRNVKAIQETLGQFKSGVVSRAHAKQLLLAVGMQDARADALLDDAEQGQDMQTAAAIESVKIIESMACEVTPNGVHRCSVKLSELSRFGRIADDAKPLDPTSEHPPIMIAKNDTGRVDLLDGHHRTNGYFKWAKDNRTNPMIVDIPVVHVTDDGLANSIADASDRMRQSKVIEQTMAALAESYDESKHPRAEHGHWAAVQRDIARANKILEQHGLPEAKAETVKLASGEELLQSSVDPDELAEHHRNVQKVNKRLESMGLEPGVKLTMDGGEVVPSHDLDEVNDALDTLKSFRRGKLQESEIDLSILSDFGLTECCSSKPLDWIDYP